MSEAARLTRTAGRVWHHDTLLILTIGIVAACGLIYEYLMAHYAGRILGVMESTIYAMIGLMIMAMGAGAFAAKWVESAFKGFAWLELWIGILGASAVLLLSGSVALSYSIPEALRTTYGLDPSIQIDGGFIQTLYQTTRLLPFVLGGLIGFLVGMEIPLIARIRQSMHSDHLEHNLGTMYGADYVGAGIGAAVWVFVCLHVPIVYAAVGTASLNAIVGVAFLWTYRRNIGTTRLLWVGHGVLVVLLIIMASFGGRWINDMSNMLFADRVVHQLKTPYQNLVLTKRHISRHKPDVLSLYINGRLQFASNDERIYHSFLTTPALLAAYNRSRVLVIGGGDGLAVRDILRWPDVDEVTLIDIDQQMLNLFRGFDENAQDWLTRDLTALNANSLNSERVKLVFQDAFIEVEAMINAAERYDVIVIDLPDPSHPDLNRLYSDVFYARLKQILSPDGAIVVQSTSPYHAKKAFVSVGRTLAHAGFLVERYRANVPSFGEWGWTIGVPKGDLPSQRIASQSALTFPDKMLGSEQMLAAFVFPVGYFDKQDQVKINRLGSHTLYRYHQDAWQAGFGVYYAESPGAPDNNE